MEAELQSVPLVYAGSLLLLVVTLIILYLKPKSSIQPSLKTTARTAPSLEVPTTPGKPSVRILYGTQVGLSDNVEQPNIDDRER